MTNTEFSRRIKIDKIRDEEVTESISATTQECEALARRFDLLGINMLKAELALNRILDGEVIEVTGHLSAEVVQKSVTTLEPVTSKIEEDFSALFAPQGYKPKSSKKHHGQEVMPEDEIEAFDRDAIDLGELTAQYLYLSLDPYPRNQDGR